MKTLLKTLIPALLGFCLAAYLFWELPLIARSTNEIIVKIPKDTKTAQEAAATLYRKKILKHPKLFRATLSVFGWDKKIQKGTYKFREYESWPILLRKLTTGEIYGIRVTFPEGWRMEQIAERLESFGITEAKEFVKTARARDLEGFLFPSTYFFEPETPADEVIAAMAGAFEKIWDENFAGQKPPRDWSKKEVVILASIIERETTNNEEKPLIAGVYLNRLAKGWKLEADPTVQYALGYWKNKITYEDLKIKSPYNTYLKYGLPQGPISNPGLDSMRAVFGPEKTNSMYFVAKGDGAHAFFETLKEHNREKALQKKAKKR